MALSNSDIRKQAYSIGKKHGKTLILVMLIRILPSTMFLLINAVFMQDKRLLSAVITFTLNILTFPVVMIGSSYTLLETWRGGKPTLSMMFRFYNRSDISKSILIGFVYFAFMRLFSVPGDISNLFPGDSFGKSALNLIGFGFSMVSILVTLRLTALPYLYCIGVSQNPFELIGESFRRMKGEVGSFIGLLITVSWWRILVSFAVGIIPGFVAMSAGLLFGSYRNIVVITMLVVGLLAFTVLSPYPYLASAGFINNLIPSEKEQRNIKKR